ncbi:MAG: TIR domain-containing protein, partial [Burkholderiales bacterium]
MAQTPPPDLLTRARQILLPLAATAEDRDTLLIQAFYLHDPLLHRIDRGGASKAFAVRLIKTLLDYGFLDEGDHALARLLATARAESGADKHAEIDALAASLKQTDAPAPKPPAPLAPPAAPAPLQTLATPREDRQPTVFISYARADQELADRLIAGLSAAGHACWVDTSAIKGGDEWAMTIADGILNSYALVPIVTSGSLRSKWVWKEILWAEQRKKRIVPWIPEDVLNQKEFFPLVDCQGVTLFDCDYAAAFHKLLRSLPNPALSHSEDAEPPVAVAANLRAATRKAELA